MKKINRSDWIKMNNKSENWKSYWAEIPWDAPNLARAECNYIGPIKSFPVKGNNKKIVVEIPIEHFFFGNMVNAKFIIVFRENVKLSPI